MSDKDLRGYIALLGQKGNEQQVIDDQFTKPLVIDFDRIEDVQMRHFIGSGTVANLSLCASEMEEADQRAASLAEKIMKK